VSSSLATTSPPFFRERPRVALATKSSHQIRKKVTKKPEISVKFCKAGIARAPLFAIVRLWNCLSAAHGVFDMHRKESLNFYQLREVSDEIF
jgi:GTP cyclohydrolase III